MNITLRCFTAILLLFGAINVYAAPSDFTVTWPEYKNATLSIKWEQGYGRGNQLGTHFTCPAATPKGSCSDPGCPYTIEVFYGETRVWNDKDQKYKLTPRYVFSSSNSDTTNPEYGSQGAIQNAIHKYCIDG